MSDEIPKPTKHPLFTKDNQPKNRGRKPSSVKKFIKDNNLNSNDMCLMAKFMVPLTTQGLKDLMTDPKTPFFMKIFAKSMLEDLKKGNLENVVKIMDRAFGKTPNKVEVSGSMNNTTTPLPMTSEGRKAELLSILENAKSMEGKESD